MDVQDEAQLSWERRGLGLLRALSWCVVAYAALQFGLLWVSSLGPVTEATLWMLGAVEVLVIGGLGTLLWIADPYKGQKPAARAQPVTRQLLLGFALGLAMKVPADALRALIDVVWPTPDAERQAKAELLRHDTVGQVIGLVVVVGIVGPIVEELFYRGSLFGDFRRALGRAGAVVLSSLLFALAHASPRDWLPLTLVALALGLARQRTSALWASTGAHVAFNLAALGLLLVGREVDVLRSWVWGAIGLVSLGLSAALLRAIR